MDSLTTKRIVFFGTPDFAVASLKAMVEAGCNVVGVVTAPDKPAGRGKKLQASAVKIYAEAQGLNILQPEKLKSADFIATLKALNADVQVVVAFRMLPEVVWNMPPLGTINVHASLLPQYRGAAPINHAILNGEKETGVTTFKLQHAIDTGNILLQDKLAILPEDNFGSLYEKLMHTGADLLLQTLKAIFDGTIEEHPQKLSDDLKEAPKLFKEMGKIDWTTNVDSIHNLIRGLSPVPGAYTFLTDKQLKIFVAHYELQAHNKSVGEYESDGKTYLKFAAQDGWLYVDELQLEGKKRMPIQAFLAGYRIEK